MYMSGELSQKVVPIWRAATLLFIFILTSLVLACGVSAQQYVHLDFDWEGDDIEGHPKEEFESCGACHGDGHMSDAKICEDCHLQHGAGPYVTGSDFSLREDYRAPLIYEHFYGAEDVSVANQSRGTARSTCFSVAPVVGGSCHGVPYLFSDRAGEYFAFNEDYAGKTMDRDPYEYAAPRSKLPDTTDCLFCHYQEDEQLRAMWGSPKQINSNHSEVANSECYRCHVDGGAVPTSFHAKELSVNVEGYKGEDVEEVKSSDNKALIVILLLILVIGIYLLDRRGRGKK